MSPDQQIRSLHFRSSRLLPERSAGLVSSLECGLLSARPETEWHTYWVCMPASSVRARYRVHYIGSLRKMPNASHHEAIYVVVKMSCEIGPHGAGACVFTPAQTGSVNN
jgi:hypothetical protein